MFITRRDNGCVMRWLLGDLLVGKGPKWPEAPAPLPLLVYLG